MQEHGEKSGKMTDYVMGDFGPVDQIKKEAKSTEFLGYETCQSSSRVVGLIEGRSRKNEIAQSATDDQIVVLDCTPFYAESGGQVADIGKISGPNGAFEVRDVQKSGDIILQDLLTTAIQFPLSLILIAEARFVELILRLIFFIMRCNRRWGLTLNNEDQK